MAADFAVTQADFALGLLRQASGEHESAVISPVSISIALAMACAGADGNTKAEMNKALVNGLSDKETHKQFSSLISVLSQEVESYTLDIANKIFIHNELKLLKAYTNKIKEAYAGQLRIADFSKKKELVNEINKWIEEQTHNKIKGVLDESVIKKDSGMMLVSAVYFKGEWAVKFYKEFTRKKPFYFSEGNERQVDMMQKTASFLYMESSDVQVLGMPYKGDGVNMFIFLPVERYGLSKLIKELDGSRMLSLIRGSQNTFIHVELPKFKLEKKFELVEALKHLGIRDAFSSTANFSAMSPQPLYLTDVIHKAIIEMDEEGTVAAAATSILRGGGYPPLFIADHPFIFALAKNDVFIFIGCFSDE